MARPTTTLDDIPARAQEWLHKAAQIRAELLTARKLVRELELMERRAVLKAYEAKATIPLIQQAVGVGKTQVLKMKARAERE